MFSLTEKQAGVKAFIVKYMADHGGLAPNYAEIAAATGQKSKGGVHRILIGLEGRGHIRRIKGAARAIEIIGGDHAAR